MKKTLILIAFACVTSFAFAQDNMMMSKKGTPILPEAKDWSIGFDASPLLEYAGNLFNHDDNSDPSADFVDGNSFTVVGLYVVNETTSYRAKARLGFGSTKNDFIVDNGATANPDDKATNTVKNSYNKITLGAGIQKNRGKGRLRGIYGAEAMISIGGGKTTTSYGVPLGDSLYIYTGETGPRTTEDKSGSTFGFGVRGFLGAEYFFAPKISISAEYGWGISLSSTGEGSLVTESFDPTDSSVSSTTIKTGKSSSFSADVDNLNGSVTLHFYF